MCFFIFKLSFYIVQVNFNLDLTLFNVQVYISPDTNKDDLFLHCMYICFLISKCCKYFKKKKLFFKCKLSFVLEKNLSFN